MLTTPEQRAEWAKLADSITGTSYPDGDDAVKLVDAAVPALCQDVEVLEAKLASEEKVSDELAEMAGKYQHDWETAQATVGRLTALLRDSIRYLPIGLRCRIEKELEGK